MAKFKRFVIAGDSHGDVLDPICERAFFDFVSDFKPELRIHSGDLFDFRNLRRGAGDEEKAESLEDDWSAGSDFFSRYFDGAKTGWYLRGNHSFVGDTEVLTKEGFKNIKLITAGDLVAEFDPNTRAVFFSNPIDIVSHHEEFVYEIEGRYSKQAVSSQHDVVLHGQKIKAINLVGQSIKERSVASSGFAVCRDTSSDSDDWIRLLTWVVCDGSLVYKKNKASVKPTCVRFKLSRERKISRLRALLDRIGVKYTFGRCAKSGVNKLDPYSFRIFGDEAREIFARLDGKKQFPERWMHLGASEFSVFLEELAVTDGRDLGSAVIWQTINRRDADLVQAWGAVNGWDVAQVHSYIHKSGFPNAKRQWRTKISRPTKTWKHNRQLRIERKPYNDTVYCLTMPMGTVVTRLHGKVAFTGNCERLWHFSESATGLLRDYANDGIKRINDMVRKSRVNMLPYDSRLGVLDIGHMRVIHGYACGIGAATKHARVYGNCFYGHTHEMSVAPVENLDGPAEARGIGCLCKIDMGYNSAQTNKLRHQNGWVYGLLFDDGTYQAFQAKRIKDTFHVATNFKSV